MGCTIEKVFSINEALAAAERGDVFIFTDKDNEEIVKVKIDCIRFYDSCVDFIGKCTNAFLASTATNKLEKLGAKFRFYKDSSKPITTWVSSYKNL